MSSGVETSLNIGSTVGDCCYTVVLLQIRRSPAGETRALPLSARGTAGFRFCCTRLLKTKNCFAFLHKVETIARDRFQISHIGVKEINLASLVREQALLFVYLLLEAVDLGPAQQKLFVRRNKQAHDYQPDRKNQQNTKNSVKSLPDRGCAARAEIGIGVIHLAHFSAVHGFVTKFFFDSQQLIIFCDS